MLASRHAIRHRRLAIGAEATAGADGVHFRVWAPAHERVVLVLEDAAGAAVVEAELQPEPEGYFSVFSDTAGPGWLYRFRFGAELDRFPDPASRFQPYGPHGPSEVVAPDGFVWTDEAWRGCSLERSVLYELHIGTFTSRGTWDSAVEQLPRLQALGITTLEVMPVAEFPGRFGWGYDGVDLFAPSHLYGTPDDFRTFVNTAHALGIGVILDVVYNHLGADGNFLSRFSNRYFSRCHTSEWGEAINFDDDAAPVREFVLANVKHWIDEYHLDGLRLDATQQIFDSARPQIVTQIANEARVAAGRRRSVLVLGENEPQQSSLIRPEAMEGNGLDALWNDDFHHAAVVALTGRREAYFSDYCGTAQEFVSLAKWGFLFQGQRYSWQQKRRGTPAFGIQPRRFVTFLENHDQLANTPWGSGERLHQVSHPGAYRAMTAYWLLSPGTPMFFQGQEFGASTPFRYFADQPPPLDDAVRRGRAKFMQQFRSPAATALYARLPVPSADETFAACHLRDDEPIAHSRSIELHRDLLAIRRSDPAFATVWPQIDGAVLSARAFVLRYFDADPRREATGAGDRLLVVNLGVDLHLDPAPEPLLAPPAGCSWTIRWSSEDPKYGGMGIAPLDTERNWLIPGCSAVLLAPCPN